MTRSYDPARDCFIAEAAQQQQQQQQQQQSSPASEDPNSQQEPRDSERAQPSESESRPPRAPSPRERRPDSRNSYRPSRNENPRQSNDNSRNRDRDSRDYRDSRGGDSYRPSHSPNRDRKRKVGNGEPDSRSPERRRRRLTSNDHTQPGHRFRYNSPPPPIIPNLPADPDPTPPTSRPPSPPRQRKRPGAASRLTDAEKARLREQLEARDAAAAAEKAAEAERLKRLAAEEQVRGHYNNKREMGKTFRTTTSRIKGLRGFNNWVKSVLIQNFSPASDFNPANPSDDPMDHLVVLDMGCGKGGDLQKWKNAPQEVGFYLGVDTADVSIAHARDRYEQMLRDSHRRRPRGNDRGRVFKAEFHAMDCWTNTIAKVPMAATIGIDQNVGPDANRMAARWGQGGGFDVVSMMFCMHYAFESEAKCRQMMSNVAGALKKGGRFIGTIPHSDVISARVTGTDKDYPEPKPPGQEEDPDQKEGVKEWGNSIYRVKFTKPPPRNGVFRPTFGWEYYFFLEEAVEEVPEYVVPWEAFRGIAEDYGLELEWRRRFWDVWSEEKARAQKLSENGQRSEVMEVARRMGILDDRTGELRVSKEEWEAIGFYAGFCFVKS